MSTKLTAPLSVPRLNGFVLQGVMVEMRWTTNLFVAHDTLCSHEPVVEHNGDVVVANVEFFVDALGVALLCRHHGGYMVDDLEKQRGFPIMQSDGNDSYA